VTRTPAALALPSVGDVLGPGAARAERFALPVGMTGYALIEPGEALPAEQQDAVFNALVTVTTASFAADMKGYWAHRRQERYFEHLSEFAVVADERGQMVGWTGYQTFVADDFTNVYVDSTGMVGADQSRGVMRAVFQERIGRAALAGLVDSGPVFVSARSESPVFYKLMRAVVAPGGLFPQASAALPADVLACAQHLAECLGQTNILQPGSLVLRNAYAAILDELYGELPSCGEPELDWLFRSELGPLDAYLLVGRAGEGSRD